MSESYYKVLGVSREADEREIKRAFHRLARELHPDKADSPDKASEMEHKFALVSTACLAKGTPAPVVGRLNAAVRETLADPAVRKRLAELGQEIVPASQQTPEVLGAYHKAEIEKWWPLIKAAGVKPE